MVAQSHWYHDSMFLAWSLVMTTTDYRGPSDFSAGSRITRSQPLELVFFLRASLSMVMHSRGSVVQMFLDGDGYMISRALFFVWGGGVGSN